VSGLGAFFAKELRETVRTWRIWVLPGFLLFAAIGAPLLTYFMPVLVERLGAAQAGLTIQVGEPTATDAYLEYLGNLSELVVFALLIAYGGLVSGELRGGTAALALSKPLSRSAFVLAKWASQLLLAALATAVATALCIALTTVLLGGGPAAHVPAAAGLWLVYAAVVLSALALFSVLLPSPAAASGAGVGVYAALVILGQFESTSRVTPAGLLTAARALVEGAPAEWAAPLASAVVVIAACLSGAVWRFSRREI
jgi:ABC-2 type transport system permease protein